MLTRREYDALLYLRSRAPCPPSLGELANHLHVSQTRAANLLRALANKNVIRREAGRHGAVGVCQNGARGDNSLSATGIRLAAKSTAR